MHAPALFPLLTCNDMILVVAIFSSEKKKSGDL
jgi:hypothetical protein